MTLKCGLIMDEINSSALVVSSGHQCSVHADIRWRSFMPIHMLKETGSWCVVGGLWFSWLRSHQDEGQAILDHKELVGRDMGREWILQNLQRPQHLWCGLHGLDCSSCSYYLTQVLENHPSSPTLLN